MRTARRAAPGGSVRLVEQRRQVEAVRLPVVRGRLEVEALGAADHLVERAEAERRHELAHFLGDEAEERLHELRLAGERLAQLRILRRDADRAGVQVADAHHHAAHHHQRRGGEAELLGAEQRRHHDVAAGLQLAVDLHDDAVAQVVQQQHLLRLGEAELPRHAGVLQAGERRGAGAAVVTRDEHDVGVRLRHAGRHRADARFGDQLDVHARARIGVLQVEDELREILDRVDVVVRRRRDQADARRRVPHLGDPRIDLVAGQLTALARLGALRHLDLQVVGVDQVLAGDAEAARGHLLDGAAPRIAVRRRARSAPGSSPPSPVFDLAPIRFMAMASVSCASWLIDPYDIAPVEKRGRIASTGSTSSSGTGGPAGFSRNRPRSVARRWLWSSTSRVYSLKMS